MHRTFGPARACAGAILALVLSSPTMAAALPLISEVLYDAVGSDTGQSFVEIYGTSGTDLTGFTILGINGSNGAVTDSVALSGLIPADGIFVVADDQGDGTSLVENADLIGRFDFQNGPDSVQLVAPDGSVVDAVGYGVFGAGDVFAGEGSPAPDAPADASLARLFADLDTDDNAVDFAVATPTPGTAPLTVPEPSSAALLGVGLWCLARGGRRRG